MPPLYDWDQWRSQGGAKEAIAPSMGRIYIYNVS
jgi:hypothetical protein